MENRSTHTLEGVDKKVPYQNEGSYWFRRMVQDLYKESDYFKVRRIREGFFRIYWKDAYVHEMYKEMPYRGYVWYTDSPYKESFKLVQEYEQDGEIQRKMKNYVEGYSEVYKAIKIRIHQFKNDKEHYNVAKDMYKQAVIK